MPIEPELFADPAQLAERLAHDILGMLEDARPGGLVLGCPAGRSLAPTYHALAHLLRERGGIDRALTLVMMDEYLTGSNPPRRCDPAEPHSCLGFAEREIARSLRGLVRGGIRILAPDPQAPDALEMELDERGGIDLFLLASGSSDGHVAFNPPGSPRDSRTRIIELPESTRRDNLLTFPHFIGLEAVPTRGVSVGIDTIARHSHAAVMVLTGIEKARAAEIILVAAGYDAAWPATVVQACANPRILMDRAAAQASISR